MNVLAALLQSVVEQGLIYGIMALGIYITYSILDFPDLSVDGTFPLGAAVTAALIVKEVNPWLCLFIAFACGGMAGFVSGFLHVKLKITGLLSGILVMTALYTVNIRIAGKSSLLSMGSRPTIFHSAFTGLLQNNARYATLLIIILITAAVKFLLDWYLTTKSGMLLRSVGDNTQFVISLAKDSGKVQVLGLVLGNGLVALAGAILCQQQGFFEINMGSGMLVMGLASVIIGITVFSKIPFIKNTTMVLMGSVVYRACLALALNFGLESIDLKMIMSVLFVVILVVQQYLKGKVDENA